MTIGSLSEIMICPASGPAAFENVQRTVAHGVPWSSLAATLNPDSADALQPLVDEQGDLYFWGFRENSRDKSDRFPKPPQSWQKLVPGTRLVFIGKNRITYAGVIGAILFDPVLSEELWGASEFGWVVGLSDVHALPGVTDDDVRAASGFARVQMSMPVPASQRANVHTLLGAQPDSSVAAPVSSLAEIDPGAPLSAWGVAERRNEQSILRKALIPGPVATCDLCGDRLPATFARAAHVKQRALCTDDEKRDVTNVLVACVVCDVAFDRGWLALDEDQRILVSNTMLVTPLLQQRLDRLRGRQVARELNASSVAFHRQHAFTP